MERKTSNKPNIAVLMSTYNGERFLKEQLESIFSQKSVNVSLFIRDDGSTDRTIDIIKKYQHKGSRVYLEQGQNIGPVNSFLSLIYRNREYEYYALADQDDLWESDKLISAVNILKKYFDTPALYYSALTLVDSRENYLRTVVPSKVSKATSLLNFQATGCTIVYNAALLKIIMKYKPKNIYMHDAWLTVIASYFGICLLDETSHIKYRQHEKNVVGMKQQNILHRAKKFFTTKKNWHYNTALDFYKGYKNYLSEEDLDRIKRILQYKKNILSKIRLINSQEVRGLPQKERDSVIRLTLFNNL